VFCPPQETFTGYAEFTKKTSFPQENLLLCRNEDAPHFLRAKTEIFSILTPLKRRKIRLCLHRVVHDCEWQSVAFHRFLCNSVWTQLCLLLLQLYDSLWVLACSIIYFHCFLSCTLCFQFFTPTFLRSFLASSSHLNLGLPFGLVAYGFHLYIVLATLHSYVTGRKFEAIESNRVATGHNCGS
jgi:hypothetical protein